MNRQSQFWQFDTSVKMITTEALAFRQTICLLTLNRIPDILSALGKAMKTIVLLFSFPLIVSSMALADDTKIRWVHGSWVNIRESAQADSKILAQLVTNTSITLVAQNSKTCEIRWGENQHGFMPCRLLGNTPLRLADTAIERFPPDHARKNPQYSPPRSFWIAPSMAALFHAGKHFQETLLSEKQLALETGNGDCCSGGKAPPIIRYPVPEFEAMKTLLSKGIVAGPDHDPPLLSCRETQKLRDQYNNNLQARNISDHKATDYDLQTEYPSRSEKYPHTYPLVDDCLQHDLQKLTLPTIRPSFFKAPQLIAPGGAGIERISAHFGITEKGRTMGLPKWEFERHGNYHYTGAWDIGKYELKLEEPVIEYVIGRNGLIGAYRWRPDLQITPFGIEIANCVEGFKNKRSGKELLAGRPAVKDALFWFQSPTALPLTKASITSRTLRPPTSKQADEQRRLYKVVVYEIDLDNDAVPDFILWDSWAAPQISGPDPLLESRRLFININGEWHPFERDGYGECT